MRFRCLISVAAALLWSASVFAATSVGVSSVAVSGQTVTVTTATAHGLGTNVGICITSTAACGVVATVPSGTTFTFTAPTGTTVVACASSCGTASLAPKVIVLSVDASQSQQVIHYVMWLTTQTPMPHGSAASAWTAGGASAGPSQAQTNALSAGYFIEVPRTVSFPMSLPLVQIQTYVQNDYTASQAALAANTQPGAFYGSVWDGAAWGIQ